VHMCGDNMVIHPFLTNLEDKISVMGGRICNTQNRGLGFIKVL
jgi:hypothetical protein